MSCYKFTIKKNPNSDGSHSIIIQFIKDRKNTSKSLGKSCKYEDWSFETNRVKNTYHKHSQLNKFIDKYSKILDDKINEFQLNDEDFTIDELMASISQKKSKVEKLTYTQFHEQHIEELRAADKLSTVRIEKDVLRSVQKFYQKEKIEFKEITPDFLYKYEAFMRGNKNNDATIGIRLRTFRAVFNKAIKREVTTLSLYPFDKFKVSKLKDSGKKEYLDEDELKLLKNYESDFPNLMFAKEMFLFSYYSRGINFIDIILLKKSDVSGDTVSYIRSKTGVNVSFKLNSYTKELIEKYAALPSSPFLFNIVKIAEPDKNYIENKKLKVLTTRINTPLKKIIESLEIQKHITYYCARHSFATVLKFNNISIDIIKEALGHSDIKSTMSYLNTLPSKKLDKIIEDVIFW
jgi:integrase/recombinase XerD